MAPILGYYTDSAVTNGKSNAEHTCISKKRDSAYESNQTYDRHQPVQAVQTAPVVFPEKPFNHDAQLSIFNTISRCMPEQDEHQQFWWKSTGKHFATMIQEADYPIERQIELLLFYRSTVVPRLGQKPTSTRPWAKSGPALQAGDGSPIGFSWGWGTGAGSKPVISHFIEPMGMMTGTAADPWNEIASKEMLMEMGKIFPEIDVSRIWKFAAHIRPASKNTGSRQVAGSSTFVGFEWAPESDGHVDVMAGLLTQTPSQLPNLLSDVFPEAMRDSSGARASLQCLSIVRDFIERDPQGRDLTVLGTTAMDCCRAGDSRLKIYATTRNLSFDHIAAVMTLGGRKRDSKHALEQMRELWYDLKNLDDEFPTSAEAPMLSDDSTKKTNVNDLTFCFDINEKYSMPCVTLEVDVRKHTRNDLAAINAVSAFLTRRGQGQDASAYVNALREMVPDHELSNGSGLQAFFAISIKKNEIDITSHFTPQVYKRYLEINAELNPGSRTQRRSLFE